MRAAASGGRRWLLGLALAAVPFVHALAEDFAFMPKGGRVLLLAWMGSPPNVTELRDLLRAQRTETQWREFVVTRSQTLSEREIATLSSYLAVNLPLAEDVVKQTDIVTTLPPDGRDLAWNECQSCHSLFASHLTQKRTLQGWLNVFLSPFHREMKMTAKQREEFAHYSTLNMPMKVEDVPPDLRF